MAVRIRLQRHGQNKRPFYRIVAAESEAPRDGRFLEIVGTYNPMTEPATVTLKEESIRNWVAQGAKPTRLVAGLLKKNIEGLLEDKEKAQREKIQERRAKRKKRSAGKEKASNPRRERKKQKRQKGAAKKAAA